MPSKMVKPYLPALVVLACVQAMPASADKLGDAAQNLCDRIKACALQQLDQQQLTPEMRNMVAPALNSMCADVRTRVHEVPLDPSAQKAALDCMHAMASADCEAFTDEKHETPEVCENYEDLVGRAMGSSN